MKASTGLRREDEVGGIGWDGKSNEVEVRFQATIL